MNVVTESGGFDPEAFEKIRKPLDIDSFDIEKVGAQSYAQERAVIGGILKDLVKVDGLCVLLVEHDLDFVRQISSRVVVLHQGKILLDGSVDEVVGSSLVKSIYSGAGHQAGSA